MYPDNFIKFYIPVLALKRTRTFCNNLLQNKSIKRKAISDQFALEQLTHTVFFTIIIQINFQSKLSEFFLTKPFTMVQESKYTAQTAKRITRFFFQNSFKKI